MDLQELREKYDRVSDNEEATATVQHAWTQVSFWGFVVLCYAETQNRERFGEKPSYTSRENKQDEESPERCCSCPV